MSRIYRLSIICFIIISSCKTAILNESGRTAEDYIPASFIGHIDVANGLEEYNVIVGVTGPETYVERDSSLVKQILPIDSVIEWKNLEKINPGPNTRQ